MLNLLTSIKASFVTLTALVLTLGLPAFSLAVASADECTPPSSSTPGVHWPTGSDAGTFTYQCDGAYAGKWLNAYYLYDPATSSRTPLYSPDYSYDCSAGKWYMTEWDYSPADDQFHSYRLVTSAPAGLDTGCPVAAPAPTAAPTGTSGTAGVNSPLIDGSSSGTGGTNSINNALNNSLTANNTTSASMNNVITGVGTSGNALVLGNTAAGSATSGNVQDIANIVNMLQSTSNSLGTDGNLVVFTANIDGDVNGDLMLDPSMISQVQPASVNTVNNDLNNTVTVNNNSNASINNNLNLGASSGDATVAGNTSAGDATSGNAAVIANLVNVINSAITSGRSFLGVININGNLNGDILLPPDFIDQLIAANVPTVTITAPDSTNASNTTVNNTTTVTNTNNQGITNNINASANSGTASVDQNTSGGSATSGSASTNITAFNLTGSNVIGANDLLVFVNVLGKWVGLIVNAPPGTTAADLGGGITQNTTVNSDTTVNNTTNQQINNQINTAASTGDASVSRNTKAGNARSGDASNAINLLNVENSSLSLSGWLGILFINVFGTWNGSFGINTAAGDPASNPVAYAAANGFAPVFRFVPSSGGSQGGGNGGSGGYDVTPYYFGATTPTDAGAGGLPTQAILANAHIHNNKAPTPQLQQSQSHVGRTTVIIAACVALYIILDAAYSRRHPEHS